tara:strand:- start:807 stop:1805 length:999 start_codon:yes stop_codon:yes gene_type:complete
MRYPKKTYPEKMADTFKGEPIPGSDGFSCSGSFLHSFAKWEEFQGWSAEDLALSARLSWSFTQWLRADKPIIRLDRALLDVLMNTSLPDELDELPPVPWEGFYVEVEGFKLLDDATGEHEAEGVFVCKDRMHPSKGDDSVIDALLFMAVGEDKGPENKDSPMFRDDTIHYFGVIAGKPLRETMHTYGHGVVAACRVVMNLLLLLSSQNNPLLLTRNVPVPPKSPKKLKRVKRQGRSLEKYWDVTLSPDWHDHKEIDKREIQSWDGPMHITTVRGHYSHYWVTDPGEGAVLAKKASSAGKKLCKVRRFIAPFRAWRRGEAPKRNVYRLINRES